MLGVLKTCLDAPLSRLVEACLTQPQLEFLEVPLSPTSCNSVHTEAAEHRWYLDQMLPWWLHGASCWDSCGGSWCCGSAHQSPPTRCCTQLLSWQLRLHAPDSGGEGSRLRPSEGFLQLDSASYSWQPDLTVLSHPGHQPAHLESTWLHSVPRELGALPPLLARAPSSLVLIRACKRPSAQRRHSKAFPGHVSMLELWDKPWPWPLRAGKQALY